MSVLDRILALLDSESIPYRRLDHAPTRTSEESAAVRGEPLAVGAKAILLKTDDTFRLFILPADKQLDSAAIKRELSVKKTRFATPEELLEFAGLVPGSVPPFGEPILPFALYADALIGTRENKVAFNAGSLTSSVIMTATDWERLANPTRFSFAK
jgi:Ala-tRNA(Pro) deacylase